MYLLLFALFTLYPVQAGTDLAPGQKAPALKLREFTKGEAISEFKPGSTYLVCFWSTWSQPSVAAVPMLNKQQTIHGSKVVVLGVNIWEKKLEEHKEALAKLLPTIQFRQASDWVEANQDSETGHMSTKWVNAALMEVPVCFIINKEGVIAWIGHPSNVEKPLQEVVDGKFDLPAFAKFFAVEQEEARKMMKLRQRLEPYRNLLDEAAKKGDKAFAAAMDEVFQKEPDLEPELAIGKVRLLAGNQKDFTSKELVDYINRCFNVLYKNDGEKINELVWDLVDPATNRTLSKEVLTELLEGIIRADAMTQKKSFHIADTYARTLFLNGKVPEAIEVQTRAVDLAVEAEDKASLKTRLEEYKKAKK